jgi:hypothetical protein
LKKLPDIRWLWIGGSAISEKGMQELKAALPRCDVIKAD